ncbi:hypothetical protein [Marinobacter sp. BGYM27]|uniref:hypothetical protein n=1 Tax=Marinobacter sp. BGYM27 TaxID=2975597 RepID=UPI0021A5F81C|nr:hypothetical protein [Marinobacter sp. BGYM27]MDG5499643.1 hypothetical protein [Marinobacter sp. BGYM27]
MAQRERLRGLIVLLMMVLVGCDAFSSAPSDSSVKYLYQKNHSVLNGFVEFCRNNPGVKWLSDGRDEIDLSTLLSAKPDPAVLSGIRNDLSNVGALSLSCTRDWSMTNYPLVAVTVPLYGVGVSVSGSSKGIMHFAHVSEFVQRKTEKGELKSLGEEGWYIYSADN